MNKPHIYLASSSPRRKQLLEQIGVRFQTLAVAIEEIQEPNEKPEAFVRRMALEKARAGRATLADCNTPVLGADTALMLDGEVIGKPRDREHGMTMLARLSGRSHDVLSAVALIADQEEVVVRSSRVTFRELSRSECADYWDASQPADKAGSYGIQGLAAVFISNLDGSYSAVMGLPLYETASLLKQFGIDVLCSNRNEGNV